MRCGLVPLMNTHQTSTNQTASTERAERHSGVLRELAEIGMDLARALRAHALAEPDAAQAADVGLVFSRISRAIRQTVALEAKLDADHETRAERAQAAQSVRDADARKIRATRQRKHVRGLVHCAIKDTADPNEVENLCFDSREHLADLDDTDFEDRPIADIVAGICRDLGLNPEAVRVAEEPGLAAAANPVIPNPPPDPTPASPNQGPVMPRNEWWNANWAAR